MNNSSFYKSNKNKYIIDLSLCRDKNFKIIKILVTRVGEYLGYRVYRKPTHTDRYLHKLFNYHPS